MRLRYAPRPMSAPAGAPLSRGRRLLFWAVLLGLDSAGEESYLRAYGHWKGNPPRLIDEHPNARAHAIIAEQVLAATAE